MGMKVIGVVTEKVVDNNPNTYLKRSENKLRIGEYDNAISELELAMKYSNHNEKIIEQCDRIKLALVRRNIKKSDFFFENKSEEEIRGMVVQIIENFETYFNSFAFLRKCRHIASEDGINSDFAKYLRLKKIIISINDILKVESSMSRESIMEYKSLFYKITKHINQYNIEDCKILIEKFYLINMEYETFKKNKF